MVASMSILIVQGSKNEMTGTMLIVRFTIVLKVGIIFSRFDVSTRSVISEVVTLANVATVM
jgi:hypothetical protein